ncbi:hypothetical protein H1235_14620 [Pseudoxanthomonas sp. NC8]|nr:hypothetical protein H1235_14620 [Pseudoxanthomonas sp. NC8]
MATVSGRTVTVVGEGSAVLTATQAAAGGYTAATAQVRLVVGARPDPTADRQVSGVLLAQARSMPPHASPRPSRTTSTTA